MHIRVPALLTIAIILTFTSFTPGQSLLIEHRNTPPLLLADEPLNLMISPTEGVTSKTLVIRDFYDHVVFSRTWKGNECVKPIHLTLPLPRFGVFRVILTTGKPNGSIVEETTFARIPDVRLTTPKPDSPFGIGAYYAMRFSPEQASVAANIQNLIGAAWNREEFLWDIIEPEKDRWTWEKADMAVRECARNNILFLGLLDYWGKWAVPLADESDVWFARYAAAVAKRYSPGAPFYQDEGLQPYPGIRHWEVWNEPATFWTGDGTRFGQLLKTASQSIRNADPKASVFFSEADETFNRDALAAAGLDAFQGVTPHYYCPPRTPEQGGVDIQMLTTPERFAALGVRGKSFWVSEVGWHSTMEPGQMRNQAVCLVRSYIYCLAAGMDKVFWYNFVNDTPDKNAHHFGLVNREDWTPRFGLGAYAAMVHFLEGARFSRRVEILKPARIFLFSKGAGTVAVLWSAGPDGVLDAPLPDDTRLSDIMSNPLPPGPIPLRADPVYLEAPSTTPEGIEHIIRAGRITGISPAHMRIGPLEGALDSFPTLTLFIANQGEQILQGILTLTPPEGWLLAGETGSISLPAEKEARIEVVFTRTVPSPDNRLTFQASFRDQAGNAAETNAVLSEMVAVYGSPRMDGDSADWARARFLHMDTADYAVGLVPWMDWNLSARFATMWDEQYFYFLGIVTDNVFHQDREGSLMWEGDGFQIGFDAVHARERVESGKGQHLFGLARTNRGDETWSWPTAPGEKDEGAGDIRFAFQKRNDGTFVYEAAIPWTRLEPIHPRNGAQFGFTILLNDNDGGGRRGWMEWTPGIGTGFAPAYFTTWTLVR